MFTADSFWRELAGTVAWETRLRAMLDERDRLEQLPMFADLGARQLDLLAVKLRVRLVEPGETVIRQGSRGDEFFIIREGEFEVLVSQAGSRKRVATLATGQYFGEVALINDTPRMATVRAKGQGSLWELDRQDFRDLLGRYMGLEDEVAKTATARLTWKSRRRS